MNEAFDKAQADDAVKCIVLTGEGRAFTSGGNLMELAEMNKDRKRAIYDVDATADMEPTASKMKMFREEASKMYCRSTRVKKSSSS